MTTLVLDTHWLMQTGGLIHMFSRWCKTGVHLRMCIDQSVVKTRVD